MATYYVRKTGSDAAAGTSAGAAWLTIGKALGAAGIASGDTVWIGAGVYREVVTVSMVSATAETKVYGDVTGTNTGDAGEIQWTGYVTNDTVAPSATTLLNMNSKNFLSFQDLVLTAGSAQLVLAAVTSTDIKFTRCYFIASGTGSSQLLSLGSGANVAINWVVDSCVFVKSVSNAIGYTLTRPATADFNVNFVMKNCLIIGGSAAAIVLVTTGANVFNPGGVDVRNCTFIGSGAFLTTGANMSTTIPCNVYNCFILSGNNVVLSANSSGQIIEDYNTIICGSSSRTNVTAGAHSKSDGSISPNFFIGHEYFSIGANLMPFGMPKPGSALLGFGNQASSPTVDILGAARPSGFVKLATGTATAGAAKTITLSTAAFGTNVFAGCTIKIISGTGSGQTKTIASNTATVITVDGNWKTNPSTDSVFEVYLRATSSTGTATAGSTTTLTDGNAAWGVNSWAGYTLTIDTGTGSGQTLIVVSNTATVLTFATATAPDNTSTYSLFRGASVNVINSGVGCYENSNSAIKETVTIRTGSNAIRIPGAGYYDFAIPVNAVSTTITIYAQYDSAYSGTLPSMNIINGTECGVANATATQVGSANSWEQLSLNFTPTSQGIITLRVLSSSTTPTGNAFFDDYNIV